MVATIADNPILNGEAIRLDRAIRTAPRWPLRPRLGRPVRTLPRQSGRPGPAWARFDPLPLGPMMEAATTAFTEQGYHGASVRAIAHLAGVTVPTLYYHHGNKQGLLVDLLNASMSDLVERSEHAVAAAGPQPLSRFVDVVDATVRFMCHRQRIARLDPEARYLDGEQRASDAALRKRFESQVLGLLEDGAAAGIFESEHAVDLNRAILGAFQSIAIWYRSDGEFGPAEIARRHVAFALDATRTDRRHRAEALRRVDDRLVAVTDDDGPLRVR